MGAFADFDTTRFPVILVHFTGELATTKNFEAYLNELEKCYEQGDRIGIIFEASQAILPKLQFQNMQAQWLRNHSEMIREKCVGTAYVITRPVIRTMLKLIFALQEQPTPYTISSNVVDAEKWVKAKLAAQP